MKTLSKKELKKLANQYPDWKLTATDTKLTKSFIFTKHLDALLFIARVTVNAEILQHHPDIQFTHNTARITLTTHEAKGITAADIELLEKIESLHIIQDVDNK